jgi:hypothetical protein
MQAGVWQSIHEAILRRFREYDQIAWDRECVDAASVPSREAASVADETHKRKKTAPCAVSSAYAESPPPPALSLRSISSTL